MAIQKLRPLHKIIRNYSILINYSLNGRATAEEQISIIILRTKRELKKK